MPKKPTRDVDKISASWLSRLIDCIEWAMNHPKGDGKTTYRNNETLSALRQSSNSLPGTGGDSYKGYFKVIQTDTNKIKIVDGLDQDSSYAGDALINDTILSNIAVQEFTITANSFIYLIVESVFGVDVATIKKFTSKQTYELGKSKTLISRVIFEDSKIKDFSQEVHGMINGNIDGDCDS